ncbi:MAG: bifunctional indole-3-glycerol-phosphate synthase TrpC/phosphoribosylanthranilate isomerase TrpF [Proteobacteria bacterium]|nr:bifunctional indole-3-glycerol-phosphate synthase TrpC/phosphoribosylanthranilate isomerase TrpF [Pseudomonadota bacterium]
MVLERIVEHKKLEVAERMKQRPMDEITRGLEPSLRSFKAALEEPRTGFILECKKASPSRGLIRPDFDPAEIAMVYARYADAISVITDNRFFQGELQYLRTVGELVKQPVLCKDFIIDPCQIYEARRFGADAVLLMLSVLDDNDLKACASVAASLGLDVLAEVHDEEELSRALDLELPIIGINNRNLKTLEIDLSVTEKLAPLVPSDRVVVAESGVLTHRDVLRLRPLANGFLVGTSLMAKPDIDLACRGLIYGPVKVCGLTRPADAEDAASAGARWGGLIFAEESPRFIDMQKARTIRETPSLSWVGVFVNKNLNQVAQTARELRLSAVQLHGDETRDYVVDLKRQLEHGCEVWKACRVRDGFPTAKETGADRILLDTFSPNIRGGTGERFDWSILKNHDLSNVILSGGLSPDCAAEADAVGAFALDVNSGVEDAPGVKSTALLDRFFAALRGIGRGI